MLTRWQLYLACSGYVVTDLVAGALRHMGVNRSSGRRHVRYDAERSADYIEWYVGLFADLLGPAGYAGDVCELGPGDSFGAGVLYRARGADSATFVERFQSPEKSERDRAVVSQLAQRARNEGLVPPEREDWRLFTGMNAARRWRDDSMRYDVIVSNSVLQHAERPIDLLQTCYDKLKPGGRMVHVVDLRNLGLLSAYGELAWLATPPRLHRWMIRYTGRPNRVRFDVYRDWALRCGGQYSFRIRHLAGAPDPFGDVSPDELPAERREASRRFIHECRKGFTPSLREVSLDDMSVQAFILCVERPADQD